MKILLPLLAALFAATAAAQPMLPAPPTNNEARVQRDTYSSGMISRSSSQVDERRFINIGMSRSAVLSKIGEPDRRTVWVITRIDTQTQFQEPYVDTYDPAPGDDQTRTRIRYTGDSVQQVEREVVR